MIDEQFLEFIGYRINPVWLQLDLGHTHTIATNCPYDILLIQCDVNLLLQ